MSDPLFDAATAWRKQSPSIAKGAHCRRDTANPEHSLANVGLAKFYLGKDCVPIT
ncbi:hypothetical protein [Burkholderia sp. PU8-34]